MFLISSRITQMLLLCGCLFASAVSTAAAAPADIDRTFGQEGVTRVQSEQGNYAYPEDMAISPSGEIYVLRSVLNCSATPCRNEQEVSRFMPGGLLDTAFGGTGFRRLLKSTGGFRYAHSGSIAVAPDGRIVLGSTSEGRVLLARLNPDGSPDAAFGSGGEVRTDLSVPVDRVRIAVQADGRVVVGAESRPGYGGDAVLVARYTTQGRPDPSFRKGNALITSLGSGFGGIALSGSKTVIAGPRCCGADGRAVHLTRIDGNGVFDSGFGRQGERFVDDVTEGTGVGALLVLPKGRIVVVGSGRTGKGDSFALKLKSNGAFDPKFGRRGIAYLKHRSLTVNDAVVDRAGRLLIAGSGPKEIPGGSVSGSRTLSVMRRLSNGRPDPTFAGGALIHLASLPAGHADAVGLQQGGRLVVLASRAQCFRSCEPPTTVLVRFLGGTSGSRCLGRRATIVGTRHGERLVGTPHRDVIAALSGNDRVLGKGGGDLICGGQGDDRLIGGKGRDVLRGRAGRNRLSQ